MALQLEEHGASYDHIGKVFWLALMVAIIRLFITPFLIQKKTQESMLQLSIMFQDTGFILGSSSEHIQFSYLQFHSQSTNFPSSSCLFLCCQNYLLDLSAFLCSSLCNSCLFCQFGVLLGILSHGQPLGIRTIQRLFYSICFILVETGILIPSKAMC